MSLNHFSQDFSQTHWWHQPQQHEPTSSSNFWPNHSQFIKTHPLSGLRFDLNNEEDDAPADNQEEEEEVLEEGGGHDIIVPIPKEALFEKPLTPSDVGKLNRLVIPKQHAEKYFPLNGVSESGEKGLLLSFEDELGKPWRFRYSYWNSSQSYVLTKGWSRFVKEKKLDAGDVVQFQRHRNDSERMFIGWRRRKNVGGGGENVLPATATAAGGLVVASTGGGGGWQPYPVPVPQTSSHGPPPGAALSLPYPPPASGHAAGGGGGRESRTITTAAASASGNCKRLRLFGVNMECQQQPDYDSASSSTHFPDPDPFPGSGGPAPSSPHYHYYPKLLHTHYDHMEVDYPRDISQSRYQQEE